jgi:hypothetical protein
VPTDTLRTRLESELAGITPARRGNIITDAQHETARPFAKVCARLFWDTHAHTRRDNPERVAAPSALLPPLV